MGEITPKYFFMMPNLIDDLPLSPAAFRLYAHFKRVAGETGKCTESSTTLAEKLHMSKSTVARSQRELSLWGLIAVEKKRGEHGEFDSNVVTIKDVWNHNNSLYHLLYVELKDKVNAREILGMYREGKLEEAQEILTRLIDGMSNQY